jgi:putative phosphoesterase
MRIGILSDTHDQADMTRIAVALLKEQGAEFYIHCGDVGEQRVLDQLAGIPVAFIWGNNDWDRRLLGEYAKSLGIGCHGDMADLTLDGKRIAVIHGDNLTLKRKLLDEQQHDYLLQGHTHLRQDERSGRTRIINPGALYRAREKSVALLNTETDQLRFFVVPAA